MYLNAKDLETTNKKGLSSKTNLLHIFAFIKANVRQKIACNSPEVNLLILTKPKEEIFNLCCFLETAFEGNEI